MRYGLAYLGEAEFSDMWRENLDQEVHGKGWRVSATDLCKVNSTWISC